MQEHTTTLNWDRILVSGLWLLVVVLVGGAWYMADQGHVHHHRGMLLATTGASLSAFTAVLHIKLYAIRVCALIRTVAKVRGEDGPEIRSVR